MKRLDGEAKEKERERGEEGKREGGRETKRRRVGDEGAFPVRSVEKGDRGGYEVVAWVCVVLVLVERGWRERRRE